MRRGLWCDSRAWLAALLWICGPVLADAKAWFEDGAPGAGLTFTQFNGMSGEYYLVENLSGGAALLDYDNDGDLDLYLVQGRMLGPNKTLADALFPPLPGTELLDRLYRNDLVVSADGRRRLRFTDVTAQAGIRAEGYGMGVAAGDYDNDGWVDLYIVNFGANELWRNNGDGTFRNVTAQTGADDPRLSVAASFVDYDRDGWLDLFVANYVDFTPEKNRACYAPNSIRDYCSPDLYQPVSDRLLHNRGDGTFEDVSMAAGIARTAGNGLGVISADFNADGWPDLYVANDLMPNHLWINLKDGRFRDDALLAGAAVNVDGVAEASMGVDAADFDGDGDEDLFMSHFFGETNTLYVNDGKGWFEDRTGSAGLGPASKPFTGFGTAWFDYDNDGWLDLFVANGGVNVIPVLVRAGDPYPLHQPNQLFVNRAGVRFEEVSAQAGAVFALSEVSRGAAFGDIDNDGDTDIVVANNNGPVRLLVNQVGSARHWVGLRLVSRSGRDALGARVAVYRAGAAPLWRRVRSDGSYASANDPRVLVGLGESAELERVVVHWPGGAVEQWRGVKTGTYTTLREGRGEAVP